MRRIEVLDKAAEAGIKYRDINVNPTFGSAYFTSVDAGNDLPDFSEVIWDHDIDEILEIMKRFEIFEFTISSTFSSLIETLAAFEKEGIRMAGLTEVNATYSDWKTGKKARIPAIRMIL